MEVIETFASPVGTFSAVYLPSFMGALTEGPPLLGTNKMVPAGIGVPLYVTVPVMVPLPPQPAVQRSRFTVNRRIDVRFIREESLCVCWPFAGRRESASTRKRRCNHSYHQSGPRTSPPCGVTADHQVTPLTPWATTRTLPSNMPARMPPVCPVFGKLPAPQPPVPLPVLLHPNLGWI